MARALLFPRSSAMHGFVTTRHLVTHAPTIVREFGWRVFLTCLARCVRPRRRATFLSVVGDCQRADLR